MIEIYLRCYPSALEPQKYPPHDLTSKDSDDQSFFINGSKSWKISSSLLELKDFILHLSMDVLKDFILVALLDGHVQVIKIWKILSLLFKLEDFILALSMDVLKNFILVLLFEATSRERKRQGLTSIRLMPGCSESNWAWNRSHCERGYIVSENLYI